jgi:predicted metal-binding membrane protein
VSTQWSRAALTVALRQPARALLLVSAAGWATMAWLLSGHAESHAAGAAWQAGHAGVSRAAELSHSVGLFVAFWLVMLAAMAPPLLLREVSFLWRASLRRVRYLSVSCFLCGYVSVWLVAGVVLATASQWLAGSVERMAAAVILVALWYCSPARQRCLNACHRTPTMRVFGTAAQLDSLRYGVLTGWYCIATCGLAMLVLLLVPEHHLVGMGLAAVLAALERHLPPRRPRWRLPIVRARSMEWVDLPIPRNGAVRSL